MVLPRHEADLEIARVSIRDLKYSGVLVICYSAMKSNILMM